MALQLKHLLTSGFLIVASVTPSLGWSAATEEHPTKGARTQAGLTTKASDQAGQHYQQAIKRFQKGDYAGAIQALQVALDLAPDALDTLWLLASSYESSGNLDQAIRSYEQIMNKTPKDSQQHQLADHKRRYTMATRSAKSGDIASARKTFARLALERPDDILALYSLGVADMLSNRFSEAKTAFKQVLGLDKDYVNAYLNLSRIEQQNGAISAAADHLRKVIELSPAQSPTAQTAHIELKLIEARLLLDEGNGPAALELYEGILAQRPKELRALLPIAEIYRNLGDSQKAAPLYERILLLTPENHTLRIYLAQAYISRGQIKAAYHALQTLIKSATTGPAHEQAIALLAPLLQTRQGRALETDRLDQLLLKLEDTIKQDPKNWAARRQAATIYLKRRQWSKARIQLEPLRKGQPMDIWTHLALATIYDQLSLFEETMNEYTWLVMLEKNDLRNRKFVGFLLLAAGKYLYASGQAKLSEHMFSQLLEHDPNNVLANFYMGLISARENDMLKSVENYQRVLRLMPTHVGARLNLASSYERLNREEDALDEYHKILAANPPAELAKAARDRIKIVERRMRGFDGSLSYATTLDGNSNLSKDMPSNELRSDLNLTLNYRYKMANGLRWRASFNPSYSNFHYNQIDFLNIASTLSADISLNSITYVAGATRRTSQGLLTANRSSDSNTLFSEGVTHVNLPHVLSLSWAKNVPTDIQMNLSYTRFNSTSSPFFSANTISAGINLGQPAWTRSMAHLGYHYVKNNNLELIGSDYAYLSHGITFRLEQGFLKGGVLNMQYGYTLFNYINADSFSRFTRVRRNTRQNLSIGASYGFEKGVGIFATVAREVNHSNLPVGLIINAADIIEGQQSSSLSDYQRTTISIGVSLTF